MLSSTRQAIACIFCIFIAAILAQSQTPPVKELTSTISGRVTVKDKPVAGVVMSLRFNDRSGRDRLTTYQGRTDVNGEYRITNVPAGTYLLVPLAPSFVSVEDDPKVLIISKGETIEHVDFTLTRGAAITGKVVDADGRPVVEQVIQIYFDTNTGKNSFVPSGAQGQTDDRGIYRVYGLRPGSYKVAAGHGDEGAYGNYMPAFYKRTYHPSTPDPAQATAIELSEGGEATNVDITLGRSMSTFTATGRVIDSETGQPVANVSYGVVQLITPNHRSSTSNGAVTNSRGEFKLENLLPGKYALFIQPTPTFNWNAEETPFEIVDEDVSGIVVRTRKGAIVSGVVVLEGTEDKAAAELFRRTMLAATVSVPNGERGTSGWTQIGADGSFTISGLGTGTAVFQIPSSQRFRITRIERNGVVQPRGVEVREGEQVAGLRLVVSFGNASIRGVIEVASGTLPPKANFYIWLRNLSEDPTIASSSRFAADVDARGQFVIEGLQPGTYELNAGIVLREMRMMLPAKKQQIEVTAGSSNNITVSVDIPANLPRPGELPGNVPRP